MNLRVLPLAVCILLCSLAARAVTQSELALIKRHYFELLIPNETDPYQLKKKLCAIPPEEEVSDQAVVELQQRYPFDTNKIQRLLSSLAADGSWTDINYQDDKRSGWEPKDHAERILELVKLFHSRQTDYYHSAEVEQAIHKALHYWFSTKPVCLNWWYNQIGVPKTMGTAFVLFEQQLTPAEKESAIELMQQSQFGMTGQNKVWLAGNVLMRALLQEDVALARQARDSIASEIVMGQEEGIRADWCFHQHGAQQQFGNYGLSFISGMSFYSALFNGTSLSFDEAQLTILRNLLEKGFRWVMWKDQMDINALGRQLFHHAPVHKGLSLLFATSELNDDAARTLSLPLVGHKHFECSDYTLHRRPHWAASLKMASNRVCGVESMNGDNLQGFYMADGATYIYKDGAEYLDIFPLWDWRKLPGVTALQDEAPMPPIQVFEPRNKTDLVGGLTVGEQGMSAMEICRAGLHARKAWLFTDDFVLCLGAGIHSDSALVAATAIEQCHRRGGLQQLVHGKWLDVETIHTDKGKELRYYHNQTGYIVFGNTASCTAKVEKRKGSWSEVMRMYTPKEVEGELCTIWLEHGVAPQNASYQYLILPAVQQQTVRDFPLHRVKVLRNEARLQMVYLPDEATYWLVAYEPQTIELAKRHAVELGTPGIYQLKKENGAWQITAFKSFHGCGSIDSQL